MHVIREKLPALEGEQRVQRSACTLTPRGVTYYIPLGAPRGPQRGPDAVSGAIHPSRIPGFLLCSNDPQKDALTL